MCRCQAVHLLLLSQLLVLQSSKKLFVPAKSPVLIPNLLKSIISMPATHSVPMDCSSDNDSSTILHSRQPSFQGRALPAALSTKIPVLSKIKVLRHSCGVAKPCFYCKAMRWPTEDDTTNASVVQKEPFDSMISKIHQSLCFHY